MTETASRDTENWLQAARGEGVWGGAERAAVSRLSCYVRRMERQELLHSTGNHAQHPVTCPNGKEYKKEYEQAASLVAQMVKNPPANAGNVRNPGSIPGSGRSPGEGNGNPLQYSCLESSVDRGAWRATVHGVA